ncbi:MAG TPA: 23S rRNA (pseudouridine(1915)-N(3))-methyltransferase RlmH [Aestuariivirga sp.]|jgi:23S rRNA (pseudouridine1915-N3)-methyltransferase|nr:23S rRNA (pseudouridine(1915)-N(3))-methyltransferase RlmH [Aestuariivirga sp.]
MRLQVLAIGKLKAGPEKTLAQEYQTRLEGLGRKAGITRLTVTDFAESQSQTASQRQDEEAKLLGAALAPKAFALVLDERGKSLTSEAFSRLLQRHLDQGTQDLAILIGGPDGHSALTRKTAGQLISLGEMTWPHRLVRVMLLEQIYRAVTIMVNHPYHRI